MEPNYPPVPFIRRRMHGKSDAEIADAEARFARVLKILIDVAMQEEFDSPRGSAQTEESEAA